MHEIKVRIKVYCIYRTDFLYKTPCFSTVSLLLIQSEYFLLNDNWQVFWRTDICSILFSRSFSGNR